MASRWTNDQLDSLGEVQEIRVAGRRRDGSLRTPVIVWMVPVGNDLYTRSVNDAVDAAYRSKYEQYPSPVATITSPPARATTLKLVPHAEPPR
jgi:hypothetical protein